MDVHTFVDGLKEKGARPPSVVILHGANDLLKENVIRALTGRFPEFATNTVRLAADETDPRRLEVELYSLSLFDARKLAVFDVGRQTAAPVVDAVNRFIAAPSAAATLVLLTKSLKDCALQPGDATTVLACPIGKEGPAPQAISAEFAARGKTIAPAALQELLRRTGAGNPLALRQEIDKLCAYAGKRKIVAIDDVRTLVREDPDYKPFVILNAISNGRTSEALDAVHHDLRNGHAPFEILGSIAQSERRLLEAKFLFQSGADNATMIGKFGIKPERISGFVKIVRDQKTDDIRGRLREILDADLRMKTSSARPETILEDLVIRLCNRRASR